MVVHSYYPLGEPRVEREAHALLASGYEVDVVCLKAAGEPAVDKVEGVDVYRLPVGRHRGRGTVVQFFEYLSFFFMAFFKLISLHRRRRYGVVQAHNLPDFLIFAALVPKLGHARLILDLHDLMPEFYAASFKQGMQSWQVKLLVLQERICCRFADQVITVTELWKQTLIRRGVPAEKITVVMNVADSNVFQRPSAGNSPSQNGGFHLIYHGTLAHRLGVDMVIRAVAGLRSQIPGLRLTIHGRGEFLTELKELANELGVEEQICFSTRYMPITDLPKMISQADAGVVPYRRNVFNDDILPTKMMEYVALGVPVIAARTPAIELYFKDNMVQFFEPGEVDDLAGCILALYQDRSRLARLARNADQFNHRYSWAAVASDYAALVNKLNTH